MAPVYRTSDPFVASATRGLTLGITMAPTLWLAREVSQDALYAAIPVLFVAALLAAVANCLMALAMRRLKVGVFSAVCHCGSVITLTILGAVAFGEVLTPLQLLGAGGMLLGNLVLLGGKRSEGGPSLHDRMGIVFALVAAIFIASAFTVVGSASRTLDPFIAAYLWETMIGFVILGGCAVRAIASGGTIPLLSARGIGNVAARSFPTAIGTASFALATTRGKMGVVGAVNSCSILVAALFSWWLLGERLTERQWLGVGMVVLGLVSLQLFEMN